jgi:hypothetical protein
MKSKIDDAAEFATDGNAALLIIVGNMVQALELISGLNPWNPWNAIRVRRIAKLALERRTVRLRER